MGLTYVSATVMAKEGCEAALEAELVKVLAPVRAEDGCIRYDLHKSEYGNAFLFYEIWESPAHLAVHAKTPHIEAMRDATAELVAGVSEVNVWEAVDVTE
ncbi:putative quinol monooxygenase [Pseudodesulfovibrio sediminis]|uniref:ABM domain-containing protein n=1 Tax=Pseudodesulfovibrio sediminis TaxID=2810563 RepID=A0ABM7P5M0_9BACT|nr:putative quinol monooxygenase [Pseudodesulfovibrio sediminis]BCS88231.1 hypothetical protein PSDVSF_14730 [Pseudodesulfovibrio sediminis]